MSRPTTFFKIDRAIFEHWISSGEPYDKFHAWIWLIGNANFAETKKLYKGKVQVVKRGELVTSDAKLSEIWGWSRGKVRRFLTLLEKEEMITLNGTADGTTITIENYSLFQNGRSGNGTADGTPDGTPDGTADGTHNKKVKKVKNNKEYTLCVSSATETEEERIERVLREVAKGD